MLVNKTQSLQEFVQERLQLMQYSFSKEKAMEETGLSDAAFRMAASRLRKKSQLIQPWQGFFVIVPPQYQRRGAPPATFFIDQLMNYLNKPYYVGLLSAASMFGAAHHAPQEFQVLVPNQMRKIKIEHLRIVFIQNSYLDEISTSRRTTETGEITVSTPEATALDLVYYDDRSGYLDNVATVLSDLAERLDPEQLLKASKNYHSRASVQRLGYMLDFLGVKELTIPLADWLSSQKLSRVPLSTRKPRSQGSRNRTWEIYVNQELNPD